jgi:holo-[acyl-carrier protein] synthase
MIVGIGTDLVEVARIAKAVQRWENAFARRVLSRDELKEYEQSAAKERFLAKRFCAKEAASKALGTGMAMGVGFRQINVRHDSKGAPSLKLEGNAGARARELGVTSAWLTISDEREYAVAFVVLEQ